MNGFNTALDANEVALNSAGSAVQENERYMDSLAAKVSQFKSAWEALSNSVVNSDLVKFIISLGTGVLKGLNSDLGVTIAQFALITGTLTGATSLFAKFGANLIGGINALDSFSTAATGASGALATLSASAPLVAAGLATLSLIIVPIFSEMMELKSLSSETFDQLQNSLQQANAQFENTRKTTQATAKTALEYVDRLEELDEQTKRTVDEQYEYESIIESLNSLFPELNLKIDANTGKLSAQTQSIREQITAWEDLATAQAMQELRQAKLTAKLEAQTSLSAKKFEQSQLQTQLEALKEGGVKGYAEQTGTSAYAWSTLLSYRREGNILSKKISSLNKDIDSTQKLLDSAEQEYQAIQRESEQYLIEQKRKEETRASRGKRAQQQTPQAIDIAGTAVEGAAGSGYYDVSAYAKDFTFDYSSWLKEQQHALNTGKIQEADYYASLQAMLDKYTDESIISTDERWKAEEAIYKYQKNLSKEQQTAYEKKVKEQQQAAENAAKAAQQEAQAQTTAYKQAFTDWLDEKEYLLNTDQITEQEYYDALKAKNEEYYGGKSEYLSEYRKYAETIYKWEKSQNEEIAKAAKQAHEDEFDSWLAKMEHALAMGEISEEDYYERLKEMSDEYFKGDEEYLEKYWKYEEQYFSWKQKQIETAAETEKKAQEEALERQKEKLKLQQQELQTEQDNLNAVISYAQKYSQKQIDDIDERINKLKDEADAIKDGYQDQIDKLEETNKALDDQIEKQKLLEALAKAQQTKKYVFKDGRFQYVDDVDAITSAQEALDNYNRQQSLNERVALLEKQRDAELASNEAAQAALEQQKQRWQDYKDGWANLTDEYEYNQNELLALEQYSIDFEKATWDERIANLNDFKERYAQNVKDLEKLAVRLNSLETSSSSSGTIQTATKVDPDQAILDEMKANSQAWWFASTDEEREAIHKRNVELNEMLSKKGTYDSGLGKWSHYAKGTTSAKGGLSLVGERGAELRVLNKGDGVVPARMTENLMDWGAQKPNDFANKMLNKGKEVLSNIINVGNVSLPNVQNAKEFVSELKNLAYQAAYSRT